MSGPDTPSSTSQTVTNTPDPQTQAWRSQVIGAAGANYGNQPAYQGQTVVPFSSQTTQGLDALTSQAQQGATNYGAANDALNTAMTGTNPALATAMQFASGANINPYLDSMYASASRPVIDSVNAQFEKAGRFGPNAAYGEGMTKGLGDLASNIYGNGYNQAQQAQLAGIDAAGSIYSGQNSDAERAAALLPSVYNYGSMPGQSLAGVGGVYQGQAQNVADTALANYYGPSAQNNAYLNQYASIVNGLPQFGTTTSNGTSSPAQNSGMGALGGAMSGASIGSAFGPWGTGIGAGIGGLWGLFS